MSDNLKLKRSEFIEKFFPNESGKLTELQKTILASFDSGGDYRLIISTPVRRGRGFVNNICKEIKESAE